MAAKGEMRSDQQEDEKKEDEPIVADRLSYSFNISAQEEVKGIVQEPQDDQLSTAAAKAPSNSLIGLSKEEKRRERNRIKNNKRREVKKKKQAASTAAAA